MKLEVAKAYINLRWADILIVTTEEKTDFTNTSFTKKEEMGDKIIVTTYITRRNCFGDVHDADEKLAWQGPSAWVTGGSSWTYEYRLRRTGVLTTPIILKKD